MAGAVLLSGYDEEHFDALRHAGFPVLLIRGDHDQRTPAFILHNATQADSVHTLEVPGGHFALVESPEAVLGAIDDFCAAR